jgi:hypothetical protein
MSLLLSFFLILLSHFTGYEAGTVWLVAAQAILLLGFVAEKHVTSAGSFIFMSFLFFGMRPLYLLFEGDLDLFSKLFHLTVSPEMLLRGLWWASAALWCFALGVHLQRMGGGWKINKLSRLSWDQMQAASQEFTVSARASNLGLLLQAVALAAMMMMSGAGRSLYGSALGAYVYDFPMVLQGIQIFGIGVALERWRGRKKGTSRYRLALSFLMLLMTSWLARDVTIFRGAYITPLMAAGLCLMFRYKGKVSYLLLIVPLVLLLPLFRTLGETRTLGNENVSEELSKQIAKVFDPASYWRFFNSTGDMNIYDTFVAANEWEPSKKPYFMSWLYVPLHLVPRKVWPGKPERGTLQDLKYTHGAPYSPGIAGFFLGDGGRIWMLGCMMVLGCILSWMDMKILKMRPGYFKICAYGLVAVNALYLTRFFLWQYTYQLLYMLLPCWGLSKLVKIARRRGQGEGDHREIESTNGDWDEMRIQEVGK